MQLPARPRIDFSAAVSNGGARFARRRGSRHRSAAWQPFASRARGARRAGGASCDTFIDRRAELVGSDVEYRVMESFETLMLAGVDVVPDGYGPADIGDEILDRVSPFRVPVHEQLRDLIEQESAISRRNVMMPNEYVDNSVLSFVNEHKDWPRARLEIGLNRLLYFHTQLHELGHCLGLRHDFGASADTGNYDDEYYHINRQFPLPDPSDYDVDGASGLNAGEQVAFETALDEVRRKRELAGIDTHMDSSVMEYNAQWYNRTVSEAGDTTSLR